ncbi:MAG TPA: fibronectin type III-like domain-contianing protein, partial [Actinoplanes sp.]
DDIAVDGTEAVVTLTNSGARAGREVVQVYLAPGASDPNRPERWLAGFANVFARPGETVTVRVPLPPRAFQIWTESGWQTVTGDYRVIAAHAIDADRLEALLTV